MYVQSASKDLSRDSFELFCFGSSRSTSSVLLSGFVCLILVSAVSPLLVSVLRMSSDLLQCSLSWRFDRFTPASLASSSAGMRRLYLQKEGLQALYYLGWQETILVLN